MSVHSNEKRGKKQRQKFIYLTPDMTLIPSEEHYTEYCLKKYIEYQRKIKLPKQLHYKKTEKCDPEDLKFKRHLAVKLLKQNRAFIGTPGFPRGLWSVYKNSQKYPLTERQCDFAISALGKKKNTDD
jgi:hypothetical protein